MWGGAGHVMWKLLLTAWQVIQPVYNLAQTCLIGWYGAVL